MYVYNTFGVVGVDLLTEEGLQVCRVSERWVRDDKIVFVPNYKTPQYDKAVKSHELPNNKFKEYEYVRRKVCGKTFFFII